MEEELAEVGAEVVGEMDELDQMADDSDRFRQEVAENCHRPLKMRTRKAGREYTVTVCTSEYILGAPESAEENRRMPTYTETRKV